MWVWFWFVQEGGHQESRTDQGTLEGSGKKKRVCKGSIIAHVPHPLDVTVCACMFVSAFVSALVSASVSE